MNILIAGSGSVGFITAEYYVREGHNVTIIDTNSEKLAQIQEHLDLNIVEGSATDYSTLTKADIHNCEVFLALTEKDETNIIACNLAKHAKVPRKIARLNEDTHLKNQNAKAFKELGVDEIIETEQILTREILSRLINPGSTFLQKFLSDEITVFGFKFNKESIHFRKKFKDISLPEQLFPFALIKESSLQKYNSEIDIDDRTYLYASCPSSEFDKVLEFLNQGLAKPKRIAIYGSGYKSDLTTGSLIEKLNENRIQDVEIIIDNEETATEVSRNTSAPIILEDPSNPLFARSNDLEGKDAFIALSNNFEKNIFSAILAHQNQLSYVISLVRYAEHTNFISTIPITSFINPALATANQIMLQHNLDSNTRRATVIYNQLELMELQISTKSKLYKKHLNELNFKKSKIIGILRNQELISVQNNPQFKNKDIIVIAAYVDEKQQIDNLI